LAATKSLRVVTSVLVAFPRSPMTVAHAAWDLQAFSGGRFELGLGSRVRGNMVGRYSMAWSPPILRMREYVGALRAIFVSWQEGGSPGFRGRALSLYQDAALLQSGPSRSRPDSGPSRRNRKGHDGPGGRGCGRSDAPSHPYITAISARGDLVLREAIWPSIEKGVRRSGRDPELVELMVADLIATGPDPETLAEARAGIRELLGFLYSTPANWPSLELYGWQEIGRRLHALVREGRWGDMSRQISDEIMDELVPSASYGEIVGLLGERIDGRASRMTFPMPNRPEFESEARKVIEALGELG
jgi:alkanesulfonate monooxygenase SsuD/methylene tetrahydromethanopterin reductase-like flavin-dependent oxidoreductase (luciferase family)